jgi:hypothetical protein
LKPFLKLDVKQRPLARTGGFLFEWDRKKIASCEMLAILDGWK